MRGWIRLLTLAMGLLVTAQAYANDPYIGVGAGMFRLGDGVHKKSVGGATVIVGDDFSEYLGGEVRLGATGRTGEEFVAGPRLRLDYFFSAYLKPHYAVSDKFDVYGLLGLATLRASRTGVGIATQKKTRSGLAYGVGARYRLGDSYGLGLEFGHMLSKPKTTTQALRTSFQGLEASTVLLRFDYFLY